MAIDAEAAGMDAFMEKPFKLEELIAVYIKLMERDRQSTVRPDIDAVTSSIEPTSRSRSIWNVTKNVKIFVDANELNDMTSLQTGDDSSSLHLDGTLPGVSVNAIFTDSSNGNGMSTIIKQNNGKVYASLN